MLKQAVILAGGRGTRLGKLTDTTPKPMLPVGGRPFLEYLVRNLCRHGIDDIVLSVGFLADCFVEHFGDGHSFGACIRYCRERTPLGTGGAMRKAADMVETEFLVLNGDTIFCHNYLDLALLRHQTGTPAAMALREVPDAGRYGEVMLDDGMVAIFQEKAAHGKAAVSAGVYACHRDILGWLPPGVSSLEKDVFPSLAAGGKLAGKQYDGFFLDIGLPETFELAQSALSAWQRKPAVFLHRGGVLAVDYDHAKETRRLEWRQGARQAIKWLNDQGYLVFLVIDQSGFTRSEYSEKNFFTSTAWMREELRRAGAHLDAVYFSPHNPEVPTGEYLKTGIRRNHKPVLFDAVKEWDIDLSSSLFIGENTSDMGAARDMNIHGLLFKEVDPFSFIKAHVPALR